MPPAGQTRRRILDAALAVIGEHGVGGLTNRRVARRAGVALGSLTYHFPSQRDILREALTDFADREVDRIAGIAAELHAASVEAAVSNLEEGLLAVALGVESIAVIELYLEAARDPALQEPARRCWDAYDRIARAILDILDVEEPGAVAPEVVSFIAGTQLRWLATGDHEPGVLAEGLLRLVESHEKAQPPTRRGGR
ncbi:MAG: TetR/AcrR family transcriptional regulator [Acidimicrobiales bacterium]